MGIAKFLNKEYMHSYQLTITSEFEWAARRDDGQ
jgi:hypothetical protein